jgi:hypothetical protein
LTNDEETDSRFGSRLTHNTSVTVGVLLTIIAAAVWIARAQASTEYEIKALRSEMNSQLQVMQLKLDAGASDRWHKVDMREWAELLRDANPTLKVPTVK